MKIETVKVYKGSKSVTVNKSDVETWRELGYETSADRAKKAKAKKKAVSEKDK